VEPYRLSPLAVGKVLVAVYILESAECVSQALVVANTDSTVPGREAVDARTAKRLAQ
jgi:hypothetical protein